MTSNCINLNFQNDVVTLIHRSGVDINLLRGKKILVTGGTGFFGIWLLTALVQIKRSLHGELSLIVLSRDPEKFSRDHKNLCLSNDIKFIKGDVRNFKYVDQKITHLVHMATTNASETYAGEDQLAKLEMLYEGTKNVLSQCSNNLESILFTSSGVAYGRGHNSAIKESDLTGPDTTDTGSGMAIGKLTAEYLISYYAKQLNCKYSIARCFTFAGQYLPLDLHYAFGNFIKDALEHKNIIIRGDGKDRRSYLYIGDAIAWLLRMLVEPKNQIINVGSDFDLSIYDLAQLIAKRAGVSVDVLGKFCEVGNFRRTLYKPSTDKIKELYPTLHEWTSLQEIVDKMLNNAKSKY